MKNQVINNLWCFLNRHINFKMGTLSGILVGSVVFAININHGIFAAFGSFWKQFAFNLIMAGYNTRTCEKIAGRIQNRLVSLSAATIIPTIQAFSILFAIHYFGGTPEPGASTLWQAAGNLIIFFLLALIYRGELNAFNSNLVYLKKIYRIRTYIKNRKVNRLQAYNKQAG